MKKILAIGGAVIKTAQSELIKVITNGEIECLIHNGASIFHDFQITIDDNLRNRGITSYPLDELIENCDCNKEASLAVWNWIDYKKSPEGSVTRLCEDMDIPVLMFTALGCDFWQLSGGKWSTFATRTFYDFIELQRRMKRDNFHYVLMGSAVIQPEIFVKCQSVVHPKNFRADVVDFLDAYRPKTRIAQYGNYYKTTHKEFLEDWLKKGYPE